MREIMWNIREVRFTDVDEVYNNKDKYRTVISSFDSETLEIYKWYFYHQLCYIPYKRIKLKDLLWEYLMGCDNLQYLDLEYRQYKNCNK